MDITPWIILCAVHAPICDMHHNRMAWPLPGVSSSMECIMSVQVVASKIAAAPRHNVRYGDDRIVVVCVVRNKPSRAI